MKTVFLLFDSLNRRMLNSYGGKYLETPNFNRLTEKTIQFNNHYIGSMPYHSGSKLPANARAKSPQGCTYVCQSACMPV